VGFLDRAKKLAEQAKEKAEEALAEAKARAEAASSSGGSSGGGSATTMDRDPRWGTAYVPGMLGREGWRERGLTDPAALLPIADRDRAGVPQSTKSEIVEEPFGMGRRWSAGGRSLGLFYQLYPEHQAWEPPTGRTPFAGPGASMAANLPDGRALVFLGGAGTPVVLEATGIDDTTRAALASRVAENLASA
jgi:hypothetical protein